MSSPYSTQFLERGKPLFNYKAAGLTCLSFVALFFFMGFIFWPLVFNAMDREEQFQHRVWSKP